VSEFRHETERLILRDWREEDWAEFWRGTNTEAVMRHLGGVLDQAGMVDGRERIESYASAHGHTFWVVERKADHAVLGFCGLKRSNEEGGPQGLMEVGWRLRESAWGQGYAKEAAIASIDVGFDRFGVDQVIALTVIENEPSWGLMERLGMQRRADLDFCSTVWGVEDLSVIAYSVDAASWAEIRAESNG
jgi:RimJ/RimL family protein N-acetyltransferase